jgi:putative hydrolase of the HAD superfamily
MAIHALILDYGEVLARFQSAASVKRMADLATLDTEEFHRRYWLHRPDYDSGQASAAEYWRRVLGGGAASQELTGALIAADVDSWIDYREEVWDLAAEFKATGGKTAILSNGVPEVMDRVRSERTLSRWFDVVTLSYEVGSIKPDDGIFHACLSARGAEASSSLFVDDRRANIDAATALGLRTFHFTDDSSVAGLTTLLRENARIVAG